MNRVFFPCVRNAGRPQMPSVVVTREVGIDLSTAKPQLPTAGLATGAQLLITMGCGGDCPFLLGTNREDWPLKHPNGLPLDRVRQIRDEVLARVEAFSLRYRWDLR